MDFTTIEHDMSLLGYRVQDTGGGDTAYIKDLGINHYVMLTDTTGRSIPKGLADEVILAVYDTNQDKPQERWKGMFTSLWTFIGYSLHTGNPWEKCPQCFVDSCRRKPNDGTIFCSEHANVKSRPD